MQDKRFIFGNWLYMWDDSIVWIGINEPTEEDIKSKPNMLIIIRNKIKIEKHKEIRANLLIATDWTELPSARLTDEQRAAWLRWREDVRDWKTDIDCPIPPNESEYCLQELWDAEKHKVKL